MTEQRNAGTPGASSDSLRSGVGTMKGQFDAAADKAKDKIDSVREPVADRLRGAADVIRDKGGSLPGGASVANATQGAADRLETTADYIESHSAKEMVADLMDLVKQHPTQSLLIAGALGFLIARAFRSRD